MTVALIASIQRFLGLSTDTKPTTCPVGSTFLETDTGSFYITTDGGTTWVVKAALPFVDLPAIHPWGKGSLTVTGAQYGTEVTTADDAFNAVDAKTITHPHGVIEEIEFGLVMAVKSSAGAEAVNWKFQITDGTTWVDLIASTQRAADASTYADIYAGGRFAPVANALLTGATFQVRGMVQSAGAAGETASAKIKNSSYIKLIMRAY